MSSAVFKKIKATGRLPSPDGVSLAILRVAKNPNATIQDITGVVEMDPATAAQIIKYVNSPLAGVPGTVASLERGILLLGKLTVMSLALGHSLISQSESRNCNNFDYDNFWSESMARATVARHLSSKLGEFNPNEAFTCGLLSQLGRLALATVYPHEYAQVLNLVGTNEPIELLEIERKVFEIDHNELTSEMMADMHLPDFMFQAVRYQDDPRQEDLEPDSPAEKLFHLLYMGSLIAPLFLSWQGQSQRLAPLLSAADQIEMSPVSFSGAFDSIGKEWQEMGSIFKVPTRRVPAWAELYAKAN